LAKLPRQIGSKLAHVNASSPRIVVRRGRERLDISKNDAVFGRRATGPYRHALYSPGVKPSKNQRFEGAARSGIDLRAWAIRWDAAPCHRSSTTKVQKGEAPMRRAGGG
jgi:hypothetical protein